MDWCVDTRVRGASELAESEIASHLGRHAIEPGVVELARVEVHRALVSPEAGPLWVSLDWSGRQSVLRLRPIEKPVGTPIGAGVTRAHGEAARLAELRPGRAEEPAGTEVHLGVARPPERDIDPPPVDPDASGDMNPAHLLGLVSGEIGAGQTLEEAAARAGATAAAMADADGTVGQTGLAEIGRRLIAMERELGAEFEVVESGDHHLVLRNDRCPFGPATGRGMCRFTSALAGGLSARQGGRADVTILESLAAGDHECRLLVDTEEGLDPQVAHRYDWPPRPAPEPRDTPSTRRGFQVTLSLQLPRDRLSVPVTRHLIRAAMDEVGVVSDDADAVDLAVTEACANVIDHSGPGDAYDIAVSISPSSCHIRVVDVGRGFDHQALSLSKMAAHDAEHGRGVALMHALVDQVRFESEPERGTVVHLVKRLQFEDSAAAHKLMGNGSD